MGEKMKQLLNDQVVWFSSVLVFLGLLLALAVVYNHEKEKPESPQAIASAAFNHIISAKEWKPGMGKQPFVYHPAGFNRLAVQEWKPGMGAQPFMYHPANVNQPVWRPLPPRALPFRQGSASQATQP